MSEFVMNTRTASVQNSAGKQPSADKVSRGDSSKPEAMTDEEFSGAFLAVMNDAEEYIDGHIAPLRVAATRMYRGEPLGNEEHGRSQVVMTELRDAVLAILPSIMRIFVSGENVVEFVPTNGNTIDLADQQTAYVNYVFMQDNPGFLNLYNAFKDALVRKTGVIKWRWSDDETVTENRFSNIPAEQVVVLQSDPTVQILEITETPDPAEANKLSHASVKYSKGHPGSKCGVCKHFIANGGKCELVKAPIAPNMWCEKFEPLQPGEMPAQDARPQTFDVHIRRRFEKKRMVIECLPPEEYLINRDARDANSEYGYTMQAHRSYKTAGELVAMGFDRDEIAEYVDGSDLFQMNYEQQARNPAALAFMSQYNSPDDSQRRTLFIEAYMRVDKDGDGIAELRRIYAIGDGYHILEDEIVEEAPFAVFCPDPEPHMVIGQSVADQTMDIQYIKSNIVRNLLDSLAGSIHPRTVVVEGQVNLDDALNTEQGAIIRARNINAVNELVKPFIGQQALPVIAYVDQIKSKRTGLSDASQGLDPTMLQSATHAAVSATVSGAQERIELYARIFAETGMKRLFRGIAKCLRENQDQERVIKLNGNWIAVDPRNWEGELEVTPNVAIGKGTDQDKIQFLGLVAQKQELIIQTLGPTNPLAGLDKYRATLAQIMTLAGFKDTNRYFGQVTPDYLQQLEQKAANPPPNPQMMLVQIEQQKVQADHQLNVAKFLHDQQVDFLKDQQAREKMHLDALTKLAAIEGQHGRELNMGIADRLLQHQHDMASLQAQHMQAIHGALTQQQTDVHSTNVGAAVDDAHNQRMADVARQAAAAKAAQTGGAPSE